MNCNCIKSRSWKIHLKNHVGVQHLFATSLTRILQYAISHPEPLLKGLEEKRPKGAIAIAKTISDTFHRHAVKIWCGMMRSDETSYAAAAAAACMQTSLPRECKLSTDVCFGLPTYRHSQSRPTSVHVRVVRSLYTPSLQNLAALRWRVYDAVIRQYHFFRHLTAVTNATDLASHRDCRNRQLKPTNLSASSTSKCLVARDC